MNVRFLCMYCDVLKARIRGPPHPLVSSPLFCHRQVFILDAMHLVDCNGVTSIVAGSVLGFLCDDIRLGRDRQA